MALTSAQIIALATQKAKITGMVVQAGVMLNSILLELAQEYDMPTNLFTVTINISPTATPNFGSGPYSLPSNFLRMAVDEVVFTINSIPYSMTQITLAEMDLQLQVVGAATFPDRFATNVSANLTSAVPPGPYFYVYPPPVQAIPVQIRFYGTQQDIASPEVSTLVPWFPCQNYLNTRLLGELYALNGQTNLAAVYLGSGPPGTQSPISAPAILRRWLELQGDREMTGSSIILDRRIFRDGRHVRFGPSKVTGGI